jgi:hypothetical protein
MMLLVLALASAAPPSLQVMNTPAFERFAQVSDRTCPGRDLRFLTPADLSYKQERFEQRLSRATRKRLAQADRHWKGCSNQAGGLSCPAQNTLAALTKLGLLRRFTRFACAG